MEAVDPVEPVEPVEVELPMQLPHDPSSGEMPWLVSDQLWGAVRPLLRRMALPVVHLRGRDRFEV